MINQQKKKKTKNKAIEVIIIVFSSIALGVLILGLFILWITNPYDTKEKRQVKPIYKAAMKGVPGFRLTSVYINEKDDNVVFSLKSRKWEHSGSFSEKELEQIYKATKQLEAYLNENDWSRIHNEYKMQFNPNKQNQLYTQVKYVDGQAVFYRVFSDRTNDTTDLHMMEDVQVINMISFYPRPLDKEKAEKISKFKNLREIYFRESVDEEALTEFAKIMKKNNPECKIFVRDEEFILPK
jgi:hypothetical protein